MSEKMGSGRRSRQTAAKAARKGAKNPAAVAAYAARQKYGKERANALAAAGKRQAKAKRAGEPPAAAAGSRPPREEKPAVKDKPRSGPGRVRL